MLPETTLKNLVLNKAYTGGLFNYCNLDFYYDFIIPCNIPIQV
jgi:hypothetical protein